MSKTLEQKNTRYLLTWLPVVLLLGSLLFFMILDRHADHMKEKQLDLKQQNIWKAFTRQAGLLPMEISGEYAISKTDSSFMKLTNKPANTDSGYTILTKQYSWNGNTYLLTTFVTSKEYTHLLIKVFVTEVFIFILLLLSIVIINRSSSRRLWKPFYETLNTTGKYDVVHNSIFTLKPQTGITEFDQLNMELSGLIEKINKAYCNQKQFVENASHEMQTPLAIIRSKLDLLINEQGLTEGTAFLLADITQANDRLSQMNKSLLLLAKIDNNQFPEQEQINITQLLHHMLSKYQEHYDNFPVMETFIQPDVTINANPALVEILFSNLIKNAVIHNIPGGYIHIHLNIHGLIIENKGTAIAVPPEQLFERFRKGSADSKTTGLGLALVKQIAQLHKMGLYYHYEKEIHTIKVIF